MPLITVGSLGLDTLETPFERAERVLGGSAAYFALAARLYTDVGIVAAVGDDFPEQHVELLASKGIDLTGLQREPGETFFWAGRYHYDLNSRDTLETKLGVLADFRPRLPDQYKQAPYVFMANIHPSLQMTVQEQVEDPKLVVLDSMNLWIATQKEDLTEAMRRADLVTINDEEARQYAETPSLLAAARAIMAHGPSGVVVKKGEHGVLFISRHGVFGAPALLLETVKDPTGAGDSFAGGFMGYLAETGDLSFAGLRRALIHGTAVASFTVESLGVDRLATVTRDDVEARYREILEFTTFETVALTGANG
ncbi:MAG: PfkB family carbohydrate kinase [Chloroflexota bacterium]|nr:PfkB family carbohydrate kinase [Chloroflexota bacterium]